MAVLKLRRLLTVALVSSLAGAAAAQAPTAPEATAPLQSFGSAEELEAYLKRRAQQAQPEEPAGAQVEEIVVSAQSAPSITNTQEAGVDEGGIVKLRGDTLIVLRRGRLFTLSIAGGGLKLIDSVPAYAPDVDASNDWYDEMLVSGDRVVVVGYSYGRGGTEINRFRMDGAGRLRFEDAHQLRSNDYFSDRNYASRLIGDRLIFYSPLGLDARADLVESLPQLRRWREAAEDDDFAPIASARDVYLPPAMRRHPESVEALHTVVSCDLTMPQLRCAATGIFGPESRTFYVSKTAVYVWVNQWSWRWGAETRREPTAFLYRIPLAGGRPTALAVRGGPVDQFSFREDADARRLYVLVRSDGGGDAMWRSQFAEGAVALLSLPLAAFGNGAREASSNRYRWLPTPDENAWGFRNRFVGDHVIYGSEVEVGGDDERLRGTLVVADVTGGRIKQFELPHGLNRIEALGGDALITGASGRDLALATVRLGQEGEPVRLGDQLKLSDATEADSRSHAFFFRPDAGSPRGRSGLFGLPVDRAPPDADHSALALAFVRRSNRNLTFAGTLEARAVVSERDDEDGCEASCVDWYGNARPIFIGDRVFALLGYELVEGVVRDGRIIEVARLSFMPRKR